MIKNDPQMAENDLKHAKIEAWQAHVNSITSNTVYDLFLHLCQLTALGITDKMQKKSAYGPPKKVTPGSLNRGPFENWPKCPEIRSCSGTRSTFLGSILRFF